MAGLIFFRLDSMGIIVAYFEMKKPPCGGGWERLFFLGLEFGMLSEVFFERELLLKDGFGIVFADEAEVPGFVGVAGDVFSAFGVAKDEAKHGEDFVNLGEGFAVGDHFVIFAFVRAVGLDDENVDGESGVVFGVAGFGEVFFAVVGAFFWVGRPFIPNLLLFLGATIGAVEFDLDAFVF